MQPEELMKPRYKVIADYFYSPYRVGDIIAVLDNDRSVHLTTTHYRDEFGETVDMANYFNPKRLLDYPHLFKPLRWFEERELSMLPEYLKGLKSVKKVVKYEYHGGTLDDSKTEYPSVLFENETIWCPIWMYEPATLEEYNAHINKQS